MSTRPVYKIGELPAGTRICADDDGYYFILPDGTTRRISVVPSAAPPGFTVVQTDISPDCDFSIGTVKPEPLK